MHGLVIVSLVFAFGIPAYSAVVTSIARGWWALALPVMVLGFGVSASVRAAARFVSAIVEFV
jgi:hypothetical protein